MRHGRLGAVSPSLCAILVSAAIVSDAGAGEAGGATAVGCSSLFTAGSGVGEVAAVALLLGRGGARVCAGAPRIRLRKFFSYMSSIFTICISRQYKLRQRISLNSI